MIADRAQLLPWAVLGYSGLVRLIVAPGAGLLAATALPPSSFFPGLSGVTLFAVLVRLSPDRRQAFLVGWLFGLGWFGLGLYWVAIAFYADAERFAALAVPAVMALTMACALFTGLAALLARLRYWSSSLAFAFAFAACWLLAEQLRGNWGVGFPWNPLGLVWTSSDAMLQPIAWIGSPGLSAATALAAALPVDLVDPRPRRRWIGFGIALTVLAVWFALGELRLASVATPTSTEVQLRLVQANIPQHTKWDPELAAAWFRRNLDLSQSSGATAIIWPESAVPYEIDREPIVRDLLGEAAGRGYLLTGGDRVQFEPETPVFNNSLWALNGEGDVVARYDKVDLVPFGEFLPARAILAGLGLQKLTAGTFDFEPGPGRRTIKLVGLPAFSPLICYEATFPGTAIDRHAPRPAWLLNVTNDAWFGHSWGPYQHLAMARMRAIEEGLPLVRAANTGISVITDAFGRVLQRLPLGQTGVIDAALPGSLPQPVYARYRGWLTFGLLALLLACGGAVERRG